MAKKAAEAGANSTWKDKSALHPEEKSMIHALMKFPEILERSLTEWKPNHLCQYLFELSQAFSKFYNNLRVLDADDQADRAFRLELVNAFGYTLKKGLELLGIEVPERM